MERLTKVDEQGRLLVYSISDTGLPAIILHNNPYREIVKRLKAYEDTGFEPEEFILFKRDYERHTCIGCWLKNEKEIAKKIKELKDLLELAVEELENVYEGETELTEQIREVI